MRFMLDTNICIELLRGSSVDLLARFEKYEIDEIGISSITLAELQYGVAKSRRPDHHESLLVLFCAPLAIAPFDPPAAEAYGKTRTALERAGTSIGPLDTLIAAHAISLGVTIVTNNEREFIRVPGLRVENWLRS